MKESITVTFEQYQSCLSELVEFERSVRWRLGDVILQGAETFGPMRAYRTGAEIMGKSVRWATELAKVARIFPEEKRLPDVDWYLYRLAAGAEDPQTTLQEALDREWSPKELKADLDQGRGGAASPSTEIKGEFVLDYASTLICLTPVGALDTIELGEGLSEVPVKATIKSITRRKKS